MPTPKRPDDRRTRIAEAAIGLIAGDGVRALTHRAVDRAAGLPEGSTSYHAKTRHALIALTVDELAARSTADTEALADAIAPDPEAAPLSLDELAAVVTGLVDALARRTDDMRTRYALILDLHDDPELHAKLTAPSPVHDVTRRVAAQLLRRAALPDTDDQVEALIALTDALVFHRIAIGAGASAGADPTAALVGAHLRGIAASTSATS